MAFFKDFTTALKDKWLQYYQANREWLVLQMDLNSRPTPDGGRRPASSLILGTINALDPEAAQLMLPFSKLNPDPEKLIDVLGLNFDPDMALGFRSTPDQPATAVAPAYQVPTPVSATPGYHPTPEVQPTATQAVPGYHPPVVPEEVAVQQPNVAAMAVAAAATAAVVGGAAVIPDILEDSAPLDLDEEEITIDEISMDDDLDMEVETGDMADDLDGDLSLDIDTEATDVAEEDLDLGWDDESESADVDDLDMGLDADEMGSDDLDMGLDADEMGSDDLDMGLDVEAESAGLDIDTESDVWEDDVHTQPGEETESSNDIDFGLESSDDLDADALDDLGLGSEVLAADDLDGDINLDLEADDLGSDDLGGLDSTDTDSDLDDNLGDFGLEDNSSDGLDLDIGDNLDDLGLGDDDFSSDDLGDFNLDDMGDLTTGDMDDIDIDGLTGSSDDDEISLSDFK